MRVWILLDLFYQFVEAHGESRKMYRFCRECPCQLGQSKRDGTEYPPIRAKLGIENAYLVSQFCEHTQESEYIPLQYITLKFWDNVITE